MTTRRRKPYRNSFETFTADTLLKSGYKFLYEKIRIPYKKQHHYLADWLLTDNNIIIETKGHFTGTDRTKHLLIKEQYPDLDVRFVFVDGKDNYLSKKSNTKYSDWCKRYGFKYAFGKIPTRWLNEPKKVPDSLIKKLTKN